MSHNTLQNSHTFTESSNLTTIIQPSQPLQEHSSNINYNDVNTDPSVINENNIFPKFYRDNSYSDQQPTPNENIASTSQTYPTYPLRMLRSIVNRSSLLKISLF